MSFNRTLCLWKESRDLKRVLWNFSNPIFLPGEVSCQKFLLIIFFDITTLFAPELASLSVGLDNNKDNNFITLVPTLGLYVGFCIKLDKIVAKMCHRLLVSTHCTVQKMNEQINGITPRVTSPVYKLWLFSEGRNGKNHVQFFKGFEWVAKVMFTFYQD